MLPQIRDLRTAFVATTLFLGFISSVTPRSIDPANFTIDRFEVPARYVYEIEEVPDESETDVKKNQGHVDSSLAFDMPIAVAIFSAVMLLVCCFCCLRCAVGYDGIKRDGFYYGSKNANVVDIETAKKWKTEKPIKQ